MSKRKHQSGVALFTAVFLIAAVGVLAISVALIAGQQQLGTVQSLEQTQAYYAARARLERDVATLLAGNDCDALPGVNNNDVAGFATDIDSCTRTPIDEGANPDGPPPPAPYDYYIYTLEVTASRGNRQAGTLAQRTVRVQITDAP